MPASRKPRTARQTVPPRLMPRGASRAADVSEEQALEAEEAALNDTSDDVSQLQKTMREMKSKYEVPTQLCPK